MAVVGFRKPNTILCEDFASNKTKKSVNAQAALVDEIKRNFVIAFGFMVRA